MPGQIPYLLVPTRVISGSFAVIAEIVPHIGIGSTVQHVSRLTTSQFPFVMIAFMHNCGDGNGGFAI